jgi:hypothetical protein
MLSQPMVMNLPYIKQDYLTPLILHVLEVAV